MTQEEKQELLIALCGYLPYGVMVNHPYFDEPQELDTILNYYAWEDGGIQCLCDDYGEHPHTLTECRPYLRPMSSMTEEEMTEYKKLSVLQPTNNGYDWHEVATIDALDWLLANHFDFRGLIDKGLAIDCTNLNVY